MKILTPANVQLLATYRKLARAKKIKGAIWLEFLLRKRPVRTLSGVAVIAVLVKSYPCPGKCLYCPTESGIPKSYLSNEPAVMRAVLCKFHPYKQVQMRLAALQKTGHPTDKIELIVIGGTWSWLPRQYQLWFIKECFRACNEFPAQGWSASGGGKNKSLIELQTVNEKAKHRIVGLTLETRPDYITPEEIKRMRQLGCTRVEIGVQAIDNSILQQNRRGHKVDAIVRATKLLKDAGLKVCYHMMPNLPGSTPAKDFKMFQKLFTNTHFRPDMLKIYPCVVVKGSGLYRQWQKGKYKPYTDKQLLNLLIKIKSIIPPYVRIIRVIRDIPAVSIEAGSKISNLRETVQKEMARLGLRCRCIRCREIKDWKLKIENCKLMKREYEASAGKEYFLSYEDTKKDKLIAFLRLRVPGARQILPELKGAAIIREVHTYGKLVPIGEKDEAAQHLGFGKKLIKQAEKIVKNLGIKKLAVISGVGVRDYYYRLGYRQEKTYMIKYLLL
jgi:elongator complex protein 3